MTPEEIHKSNRANAYMQMTTQSEGWKYLKAELQEKVASATKTIMNEKAWIATDEKQTGKIQVAQVRAWAYANIINLVQNSIDKEMDKRAQANQGDSQK